MFSQLSIIIVVTYRTELQSRRIEAGWGWSRWRSPESYPYNHGNAAAAADDGEGDGDGDDAAADDVGYDDFATGTLK